MIHTCIWYLPAVLTLERQVVQTLYIVVGTSLYYSYKNSSPRKEKKK